MQAPVLHTLRGQNLWLSGERALFWEEQKTVVVSDLHFGKTGHFRKSGIPVPQSVYKEDLQRLVALINHFRPTQLAVVGDFFHSHANTELDWFKRWRDDFPSLRITLIRGNHDILKDAWYRSAAIDVVEPELILDPFLFIHDRCLDNRGYYSFCGHLHPGITVHGLGRQSLRFPCFYFGEEHCVLPAFSRFTGTALVRPARHESVYAIVDGHLIRITDDHG